MTEPDMKKLREIRWRRLLFVSFWYYRPRYMLCPIVRALKCDDAALVEAFANILVMPNVEAARITCAFFLGRPV